MSAPKWIVLDANRFPVSRSSQITADEIQRQLTHGPGVVVIDPEDDAAVIDLCGAYASVDHTVGTRSMRDALRSLLPTPKPPEPMGLGAVVEDADGDRWVRAASNHQPWFFMTSDRDAVWLPYGYIDAVRVLNEGVVTR